MLKIHGPGTVYYQTHNLFDELEKAGKKIMGKQK